MSDKKKTLERKNIRSSTAEYLTYVAFIGDIPESLEMRYQDENIWLTQKMLAALYDVEVHTINEHIAKIFADEELSEQATIRNFRIVQTEGSRQVNREIKHYNLQMIIAVGFKVNNERAVQFRKWANQIVKEFTIKGFAVYEMEQLQRLVSAYLDIAEDMTLRHIPMTMLDWETRLNSFIKATDRAVLEDAGRVTAEIAKAHAETEFEKYRIVQDRLFVSDFDRQLKLIEQKIKKSRGSGNEK